MILHLRVVPGLWVAVEEGRRPELRSQPLILGGLPTERGQVREVNVAALQRGVQPGMTIAQARHQCPDGLFLQPDLPAYDAVWEWVCAVLRDFTPLVEPVEMGQAVCDLEGCERLWGDDLTAARSVGATVRERTGISPWIGMASNRITAQLASLSVGSEGITVIGRGKEAAFLADLPLTSLPDVDTRLALTFQVLGLKTIGDLAALPPAAVKQRFGKRGEHLHRLASGIDPRPVLPPPTRPTVEACDELVDGTIEEALERLQHLADQCAGELQRRRLAGTMIELRLGDPHPREHPHPSNPPLPLLGEGGTSSPPLPLNGRGGRGVRGSAGEGALPVPYRIHSSRLPQPPTSTSLLSARDAGNDVGQGFSPGPPSDTLHPPDPGLPELTPSHAGGTTIAPDDRAKALPYVHKTNIYKTRVQKTDVQRTNVQPTNIHMPGVPKVCQKTIQTVVRTPINATPALFEQAQRLLVQHWPRLEKPPETIELIVSEFPAPRQLAFAELNRIGETGGLGGLDATRFQGIAESERVLAARFGDTSFRHIGRVDPGNILTERRFFWKHGLPWKGS